MALIQVTDLSFTQMMANVEVGGTSTVGDTDAPLGPERVTVSPVARDPPSCK